MMENCKEKATSACESPTPGEGRKQEQFGVMNMDECVGCLFSTGGKVGKAKKSSTVR